MEGHFLEGRVSGLFFWAGAAGSECPKMSRSPKDRERKGTPSFTLFLFLSTKILGTPKCCRPSANTRGREGWFLFQVSGKDDGVGCYRRRRYLLLAGKRGKRVFFGELISSGNGGWGKRPSLTDG